MTSVIADTARAIISRHLALEGAALPILHALQAEFGYLPEETLPLVADALNIHARRNLRRRDLLSRFPP